MAATNKREPRNAVLRSEVKGVWPSSHTHELGRYWPSLNRSRNWRRAKSYQDARAKSPFPDRPVR